MKYWLLTTEYPPFFGGGISTYCYFTAQMLAEKGHEVSVFINDASINSIDVSSKEGIRLIRFNPLRTNSSSFLGHETNISYEFAHIVKEFIFKEGSPDCIEAQEYLGIAYYLLQYKYLLYDWCKDVPVLITMHSPSFLYMEYNHVPQYRYPNFWICEMERYCLQAADILISPSQFMLTELAERFELSNPNVNIIPNPFSANLFPAHAIEPTEENEIVFFGKLTVQKGAFKLLDYFKAMWDKGFNRPLFLLGGQDIVYHAEGKTMGDIIRKKYKNYIDKGLLRMENRIHPSEIAARLVKAEVVIVPSCNDNLPYVVFEMMALGKILLVSKQGGQSEVIKDGVNGFIFDHNQPETFELQLNKILGLSGPERAIISKQAVSSLTLYHADEIYKRKIKAINTYQKVDRKSFPFIRSSESNIAADGATFKSGMLSIVVPFYNMGRYISETIKALQRIDYPLKEIIIINDGTDDEKSLKELEHYRDIADIKVFDIANRGLAHARNYGAQKAQGEFLAFLDADDLVDVSYYSKAIRVLNKYTNVHFVGAWTQYFEGAGKVWPTFIPEGPLILYHNTTNSSALIYKRKSFLSGGKNDESMIFQGLEDYESVVSLVCNGFNGVVLPEPLFFYRVRSNSMIRSISKAKKLVLYQHISKKHKSIYARFATDVFNLLNANGPGIVMDNPTLDYHLADKIPFGGKLSRAVITQVKKNRIAKTIAYKVYRLFN